MLIITVKTEGFVRIGLRKPWVLLGFSKADVRFFCVFAYKMSTGLLGYRMKGMHSGPATMT